jgi:hypothetical protein
MISFIVQLRVPLQHDQTQRSGNSGKLLVRFGQHRVEPLVERGATVVSECLCQVAAAVEGWVEGDAVLPPAPDDPQPGACEDSASSLAARTAPEPGQAAKMCSVGMAGEQAADLCVRTATWVLSVSITAGRASNDSNSAAPTLATR